MMQRMGTKSQLLVAKCITRFAHLPLGTLCVRCFQKQKGRCWLLSCRKPHPGTESITTYLFADKYHGVIQWQSRHSYLWPTILKILKASKLRLHGRVKARASMLKSPPITICKLPVAITVIPSSTKHRYASNMECRTPDGLSSPSQHPQKDATGPPNTYMVSSNGYGSKLGTPKLWMVNTKLDIHICGPLCLPFWPTSKYHQIPIIILHHSTSFYHPRSNNRPLQSCGSLDRSVCSLEEHRTVLREALQRREFRRAWNHGAALLLR